MKSIKTLMSYQAGILFGLISVISSNADQQINIVNDTASSLNIALPIPARTEAIIQMKKLHSQNTQEMLQKAILNNSAVEVRNAVQAGADINNGKDGKSPLLWALLLQRHEAFAELIRLGSNVHVVYEGVSLVLHSLKLQDAKSALLLLNNGADGSGLINGYNAIQLVISCIGTIDDTTVLEIIQKIINHGYDANKVLVDVYLYAIMYNPICSDIINLAIRSGASPNYRIHIASISYPILCLAVLYDNKNAFRSLLNAGADVNQKVRQPNGEQSILAVAIQKGNTEIIEMLVQRGASL